VRTVAATESPHGGSRLPIGRGRSDQTRTVETVAPRYAAALAAGRVLQWSAFATWAYVAAMAVIAPMYLQLNFEAVLPVRTDTIGTLAFAASGGLLCLTGLGTVRLWSDLRHLRSVASATRSVAFHAGAAWLYVSGNSISHPDTLDLHLTHLFGWPSEGTFAVTCFIVGIMAGIGYFVIRAVYKEDPRALGSATEARHK
jgi:hypothetical protein